MFCFSWEIRHVLILEDQSVWEFQLTRKLLDLVLVKHRRWGRRVKFPSERRFSCRNECIWHCENKMNEIFIRFCFFQTRMFFFLSSYCCQDLNREVFVKCCFCQVELRLRGRSLKSHTSNLHLQVYSVHPEVSMDSTSRLLRQGS